MELLIMPEVWAKLRYMRTKKGIEISGFGVTDDEHPNAVKDFVLVKQEGSVAETEMDEKGIQDYFDDMTDKGLNPRHYARIWIHTHPGGTNPSSTDEETFRDIFGRCDWAVMLIIGQNDEVYCRAQYKGPLGNMSDKIPAKIAWDLGWTDKNDEWDTEYDDKVSEQTTVLTTKNYGGAGVVYGGGYGAGDESSLDDYGYEYDYDYNYGFSDETYAKLWDECKEDMIYWLSDHRTQNLARALSNKKSESSKEAINFVMELKKHERKRLIAEMGELYVD